MYAKTLALLGLAVLAGVGALVDYWPVGLTFPATQAPALLPDPVDRTLLAREPIEVVPVVAWAGLPARERAAALKITSRQAQAEPPAFLTAETAATSGALVPEPVLFVADDALAAASSPARIIAATPDQAVTLDHALADEAAAPAPMRASVAAASGGDDGDGLITGAFKKTGSSIVKTGARTGASIVDAMRVVSGVVRRALPTD